MDDDERWLFYFLNHYLDAVFLFIYMFVAKRSFKKKKGNQLFDLFHSEHSPFFQHN